MRSPNVASMWRPATLEQAEPLNVTLGAGEQRNFDLTIEPARVTTHIQVTSSLMAQSTIEAGKALELEALLGSVIELAQVVGIDTPVLKAVYALTRMLERQVLAKGHGLTL